MIQSSVSLKPYNTLSINVLAKYFASFYSLKAFNEIFDDISLWPTISKTLILGGGSNILFTKNFDGLVLKNEIKGIEIVREDEDYVYVKAAAGENWHNFVSFCIDKNFTGVENLSLIPGCVGASPMQNIGAYGVEIKDVFHELEAFHFKQKTMVTFNSAECGFGYRESVFKNRYRGQFVILNVTFRLNKVPTFKTSYGAINQELEKMGVKDLSIRAIGQAVINIRSSKLPDPKQIGNAGSFFKNPTIPTEQFLKLKEEFPEIIGYPVPAHEPSAISNKKSPSSIYDSPLTIHDSRLTTHDSQFTTHDQTKLAAGWLIEKCGWKGFRKGDAGVHDKQALVLVNYDNASGSEIYDLSQSIILSVKEKFNVLLEREVNII